MGNLTDAERPLSPMVAYPRGQRVRHAFRFIRDCAREGSVQLERTKARFVADTYGLETNLIKRIKARFRNELSFTEGGK
jgi:hypothetical protein